MKGGPTNLWDPNIDSQLHPNKDKNRGKWGRTEVCSAVLTEKFLRRPRVKEHKEEMYSRKRVLGKVGEMDSSVGLTMASLMSEGGPHRGASSVAGRAFFTVPKIWSSDMRSARSASVPLPEYGRVEVHPVEMTSARRRGRMEALGRDRPVGSFLVTQARSDAIADPTGEEAEDPNMTLLRRHHTAGRWMGQAPLDPRCRSSAAPLMSFGIPTMSSTTRSTYEYEPLTKASRALNEASRYRWSLQHENPGLLDPLQLTWLCRTKATS